MPIAKRRTASRQRIRVSLFAAGVLLLSLLLAPHPAAAGAISSTVLIEERFGAQTVPANFGFPTGASVGGGVLRVTENMSNYTTSVSRFDCVDNEREDT